VKKKNQYIKGIQFDGLTLRQIDDMARRWGMSRSQAVRVLVRDAASRDKQMALPGFGQGASA